MRPISATTAICAVFGHPVKHSLSPAIHNAAFEELDLDYAYVAHDVHPAGLAAAIEGTRAMGYRGLSITIPHKVAALACVDHVDGVAKGIGCINTIVNDDGRLSGHNSDGRGALSALRAADADPTGRRVVVLGSGGAARAIAITMAAEAPPASLTILGVVPSELEALVRDVGQRGPAKVVGAALDQTSLAAALRGAEILLNATPVGMHPNVDATPVPARMLRAGMVVFDAVYNPRRTRLCADAEAAGARTVAGLEMFLGQAATQFELWTGRKAPLSVMRRVLEERL
jgi:shikimate dehydrogenase